MSMSKMPRFGANCGFHTFLNKLEASHDATLVANDVQTPFLDRLFSVTFLICYFKTIRHVVPPNATQGQPLVDSSDGGVKVFDSQMLERGVDRSDVIAGVGLSHMRSKWATRLLLR